MPGALTDLSELARQVVAEIDFYVYEYPEGMVGNPWPSERVERELNAFRKALVDPYWADVAGFNHTPSVRCVVVADDRGGNVLVFDPTTYEFALAMRDGSSLANIGVTGDAVGCFLAR